MKPTTPPETDLQGEGNYDATRRYDKAARKFAKSGKVKEAAQAARPDSAEEAAELERAEQEGKSHSKGE
jgi:hypothetical protein